MRKQNVPYFLVLPCLVVLTVVMLYPLFTSIWLSFTDPKLGDPAHYNFAWLANYASMYEDPHFWPIIANTVTFTVLSIGISFLLALGAALLLNCDLRGRSILRALAFLPWAVPPVIAAMVFTAFYDSDFGLFNYVLKSVGAISEYQAWLADPDAVLYVIMSVVMWKYTPFLLIGLLAGLQAIPREMYEAALVDGASKLQRFRYVTLPQIRNISLMLVTLGAIWRFNHFDTIWAMTRGGPGYASQLMGTWAYLWLYFSDSPGHAAAIAVASMIILAVPVIVLIGKQMD